MSALIAQVLHAWGHKMPQSLNYPLEEDNHPGPGPGVVCAGSMRLIAWLDETRTVPANRQGTAISRSA